MSSTEIVPARLLLTIVDDVERGHRPQLSLLKSHPEWLSIMQAALACMNGDGIKPALRRAIDASEQPEAFDGALRAAYSERCAADDDLVRSLRGRQVLAQTESDDTALHAGSIATRVPLHGAIVESRPILDSAALHGLAGDLVRTIEPHTEADPTALLLQLLTGFGNLVGPGPHFMVEADRHPAILFTVLVGETSKARKGTALGHIRRVLRPLDPEWESRQVQSGLSSGEGLIHAVRDPQGEDATVHDRRVMIVQTEFASTLRVIEREGNTLSPMVRDAWDGRNLQVLTRNNPVSATGAHISIIGHITAEELRRHLDRTEIANGFANRFLWACSRRSKCLPEGGRLLQEDLDPLMGRLGDALAASRAVGRLVFDEDGRELWRCVYQELSEGQPGMFGAITSRAEAQVMRLALIYALLDCSGVIGRLHLEAALAAWSYCEASVRYIFGDSVGDPIADKILAGLRASQPVGMTETEINEMFGRNRRADQLHRALRQLLDLGVASLVHEDTRGRPATRWFAVGRGTKETN